MKIIKKNYLLILILIVSFVARVWNLSSVPPHLTSDEAALGYNAYSLLKTGKDEYGKLLPIIFKSFGDYKPGLYIYLTIPSVFIFGLTEFAVRFPSALMGVVAVFLIYKITQFFFPKEKNLPLISSFLMAVTPWHIYFSRGAWEANFSLTLTLLGIYFFLKSFKKEKFLIHSIISFALTLLAYQGAKMSTGIVVLLLIVIYRKNLFSFKPKIVRNGFFIGLIIALPIILSLFQGQAGRLTVFNIFSYPRPPEYTKQFIDEAGVKVNSPLYYLFYSEPLNFARGIMGRWFNHFSGRFLFFEGDWPNPRHSAPYQGMLLFSYLLYIPFGFYKIFKKRISREEAFILFWLILAPLPAALSRDQVHAVRSLNMTIPIVFVTSLGFHYLLSFLPKNKNLRFYLINSFLAIPLVGTLIYFTDVYFVHLPVHNSKYWNYGYKEIIETILPIRNNYQTIKIQQSFAQPYIFYLFYTKYDPALYQKNAELVPSEYKNDVGYVNRIDNIEFAAIDWSRNRGEKGTLFVADPLRIPPFDSTGENFNLIKEIKFLDGNETAFRILEVIK